MPLVKNTIWRWKYCLKRQHLAVNAFLFVDIRAVLILLTKYDAKKSISFTKNNNKSSFFLIILALIVGSVGASAAGLLNTESGGYLLCVNSKTKNVTYPGTQNCPKDTKKLVAGSYQIKAQALDIAGKYTDLQLLGTVTVTAPAPLIRTDIYITSDPEFKSEMAYPFRAALAQNSGPIAGVTVTFWIDGVARTAVTDSLGIAIWNLSSHASGKTSYSVYVTYAGSTTLAASTSQTRVITKYVVPDSQNPVVVVGSGVLTTSSLETSGGTVAITYRITDDVGCCGYNQAWMYYPNGTVVQQVTPSLISGDEKNGTFRASFNVPSGAVAGSYQIKAQALDIAGKYTDLQLLGTVTVTAPAPLIRTDIYITSDPEFKSEMAYPFRAALAQNSGPIAGVTVTFWIDGVARTAVTDSLGIAIWNLSSHVSGKTSYSVYVTYAGSATLAASTSQTRVITKYVG